MAPRQVTPGRSERQKRIDRAAWKLHGWGITANQLSFLQVPFLAGLAWAGYVGHILWFGTFQILVILVDGADGTLARRTNTTSRTGHLLDSLFDIVGIGVTLWAVSHLYPRLGDLAFALLFLNFLVYLQNEIQHTKAVTYSRGPVTVGLALEPWLQGILTLGLLVPMVIGVGLLFSRLDWRRRVWNWYQFLTAGRRREYKAVPREERAEATSLGGPPHVGDQEPPARAKDETPPRPGNRP